MPHPKPTDLDMTKHSDYFVWKDTSERVARRCDDTIDKKRVNSCVLQHLFLEGFEQPKMSPKNPGNAFSDALLMSRFQNFAADAAKQKPRSARFWKTALRAVLINQSIQINSGPMILRSCFLHCIHEYSMRFSIPLGPNRRQTVLELRGVCFKLWVIKSRSCFCHSPRSHIGDVLWNSEPDSRRQFSQCFGSAFLVFRKIRFRTESAKTYHRKHFPEGVHFLARWVFMYVSCIWPADVWSLHKEMSLSIPCPSALGVAAQALYGV